MPTVRIVTCIDLEVDSVLDRSEQLLAAYYRLYTTMGAVERLTDSVDWESTEEWFDTSGAAVPVHEIEEIRFEVLGRTVDLHRPEV